MVVLTPVWWQRALVRHPVHTGSVLPRDHALIDGRPVLLRCQFQKVPIIHQLADHGIQLPVELVTEYLFSFNFSLTNSAVLCV